MMNVLCLMPTYGRPQLVANALACFLAQQLPASVQAQLLICDDAGQIAPQLGETWEVISTNVRYPSLCEKYNAMLEHAGGFAGRWDAVALMDDDDIYGPRWLSSHAEALSDTQWSHPERVYSLHAPPASGPTSPGLEPSGGRFWASAAVRTDMLRLTNGFEIIRRATFDQEHLALWQRLGGDPGRPDRVEWPQYVYGWGRSNHVSVLMGGADWYERQNIMRGDRVERLEPGMDRQTASVYQRLGWE
jgi:glycosyltransferase involved in cell wall biosynthesis